MIAEVFGPTDVTVLPIHGNHDFYPPNLQDMSLGIGSSIYIDLYSQIWNAAGWLTDDEARSYKEWGYYSKYLSLKDGRDYPKTKVIALNTMACYAYDYMIAAS